MASLSHRNFALARWVDEFVEEIQSGYEWRVPSTPKLIRDAVHGYQLLHPHEVAVVDSPLVQRLRYIHQTALAYYVYPTATHVRFDHCLGVASTARGMIEGLRASAEVSDSVLYRVRLAGILHDCGHVLFSHLGEEVASDMFERELLEAKVVADGLFEDKGLGEVISYLMVTSPPFATKLDAMLQSQGIDDVNAGRIAPLFLGSSPEPSQQFEADIISGPFDADKLDYFLRDCHFSGIKATVDIERVYYTVRLLQVPGEPRALAMHSSGVPNLEQILFAKMLLYSSVYQHQKVRALECSFRGIVERLLDGVKNEQIRHPRLKLQTLADWLRLSEQQLFVLGLEEPLLANAMERLVNRRLLKRALVLSVDTVQKASQVGLISLYNDADRYETARNLSKEIHGRMAASKRGHLSDLWFDVPPPPTAIKDVLQVKITADLTSHHPLSTDRFQWDRWTNNYSLVKWRAHLFCSDEEDVRKSAARAASIVLREKYDIALSRDARAFAKN